MKTRGAGDDEAPLCLNAWPMASLAPAAGGGMLLDGERHSHPDRPLQAWQLAAG